MFIDLHVHTTRYSAGCSVLEPHVLVRAALMAGLQGVALSEHQCSWSQGELDDLRGQGLRVFSAREVNKGDLHVLVFGLNGPPPEAPDGPSLARAVQEMGGAAVLAHPFRWGRWHRLPPAELAPIWTAFNAVEALSGNMLPKECQAAQAMAETLDLAITGGSDAHAPQELGRYCTFFPDDIQDEADLARALRAGRVQARTKPNVPKP